GTPLACLMIDVDHFKRVNDEYGHLTGDGVLSQVARRIDAEVRSSDVSARYGGEEFIIVLPGTDAGAGRALAERIRRAVAAETFRLSSGGSLDVTVSIGVAELAAGPGRRDGSPAEAGEALIATADRALYAAKAGGRNLVVVADQD
ncbi:MAG: GGDEF domain-containing protein, partial [Gammaproteobacteria bacterium]|nr:GGDEF domain-containing protein [Gammaproteobacteria bacterium]